MPDQFNFNDIFGNNGIFGGPQKPSMADQFKTIAEQQKVKALQERISALEAENARLKETILRCPKCGTKLRIPR